MHSLNGGRTYFCSGQQWLTTWFLSCCCLTWWDFSPTPYFGSAAAHAAPRCGGASMAHCHTSQKAWRAAMGLAIAFLQSCTLPAFPWRYTSLRGTSLLTLCFHISGSGEYLKTVLFNTARSWAISLVSMTASKPNGAPGSRCSALTIRRQFSFCSGQSQLPSVFARRGPSWGASRAVLSPKTWSGGADTRWVRDKEAARPGREHHAMSTSPVMLPPVPSRPLTPSGVDTTADFKLLPMPCC